MYRGYSFEQFESLVSESSKVIFTRSAYKYRTRVQYLKYTSAHV